MSSQHQFNTSRHVRESRQNTFIKVEYGITAAIDMTIELNWVD